MNNSSTAKLRIPFVDIPLLSGYQEIDSALKTNGKSVKIDQINWDEYSFRPLVRLFTAHSKSYLWLLYEVEGDFFRAKALVDQGAVWEDSCVEFFIAAEIEKFDKNADPNEINYRNFEFNSLGICLSANGTKYEREMLSPIEMVKILRFPELRSENIPEEGAVFNWKIIVAIPLDLLGLQSGQSFRANFYKCGDLTRKPHFLSWNRISAQEPDFHLPIYFGELELVGE